MSAPDSPSPQDPNPDPSPPSPPQSLPPPLSSSSAAAAAVTTASGKPRRLPPPCWTLEETVALIDAYGDKRQALRLGNLKANHWQEVAEVVAARCPGATPQKTAVQCRHKMEKLRKRHRTEIQRARSVPVSRFVSSWVHYKRMEAAEKGSETKPDNGTDSGDDDHDDDDYPCRYPYSGGGYKNGVSRVKTPSGIFNRSAIAGSGGGGVGTSSVGSGGIRIRIPTGVSVAQPGAKFAGKIDQKYTTNMNSGLMANASASANLKRGLGAGFNFGARVGNAGTKREIETSDDDPMAEIASAVKLLGDVFMRTEQSKMEIAREIEAMKMEMEVKRTEMILESQRRIVESFAKALAEKKKKPKRLASIDS